MFHNRNSSMDRIGNTDIPFQDLNTHRNSSANRKTMETLASKEENMLQSQPSKFSTGPRTYAKVIAEYSQRLEENNNPTKRKESKGLLSKLPFDAVVSSLTKLERPKFDKSKIANTNHALTNNNIKNEKKKTSPTIKNDSPKRDYFTQNKTLEVNNESKEWASRIREARNKEKKVETSKSNLITALNSKNQHNNVDVTSEETVSEKESIPSKWIKPKSINVGLNSVNITVDNITAHELKAMGNKLEKLNIMTEGDKIEIQIPINTEVQTGNDSETKVSVLSLQIIAKIQENQKKPSTTTVNPHTITKDRNYNPTIKKVLEADTKTQLTSRSVDQPPKPLHMSRNSLRSHNLPWWATPEKYAVENKPKQAPLQLEDFFSDNYPSSRKKEIPPNENIKAPLTAELQRLTLSAGQRSARRRKKLTSISKITRHLEQELQGRNNNVVEAKSEVKSPMVEKQDGGKVSSDVKAKNEKKSTSVDVEKKEVKENRKEQNGKADDKNPNLAPSIGKQSELELSTSSKMEKQTVNVAISKVNEETKPNISMLHRIFDVIDRKELNKLEVKEKTNTTVMPESRKKPEKENSIDHEPKVKRIIDPMKPIEKRKDGTLIDYGLKVPSRKPRLKKAYTEKLPTKETVPKQTVSAPQHPKTKLPRKKPTITTPTKFGTEFMPQTKSELPLTKTSKMMSANDPLLTRKPAIKEEIIGNNKSSNGGRLGKSGNEGSLASLERENTGGENNSSTASITKRLANTAVDLLKTLKSEQTFIITNNTQEKHKESKLTLCENKSNGSIISERPEKELIYSAWLNRFHTRKHQILIK